MRTQKQIPLQRFVLAQFQDLRPDVGTRIAAEDRETGAFGRSHVEAGLQDDAGVVALCEIGLDLLPERSGDENSEVSLRLPIYDVDEISGCDDQVAEALVGRVVAVADNADAVTGLVPVRRSGQVEVDPPLRLLAERLRPRRELPFVGGENPGVNHNSSI